jgi:HEPN domain-containing protein
MNVTDSFLDHRFTDACNEVLELYENDRLHECVKKARELIKALALQDTTA